MIKQSNSQAGQKPKRKINVTGKIKLNKTVKKGLVTVKSYQSDTRLRLWLSSLLDVSPRGWRNFVKSDARPSGPYIVRPGNFFRKITKELSVDCARGS